VIIGLERVDHGKGEWIDCEGEMEVWLQIHSQSLIVISNIPVKKAIFFRIYSIW
jgi:hypothetical protein